MACTTSTTVVTTITATATHTTQRLRRMMPSMIVSFAMGAASASPTPSDPHVHGGSAPDSGLPEPNRERAAASSPIGAATATASNTSTESANRLQCCGSRSLTSPPVRCRRSDCRPPHQQWAAEPTKGNTPRPRSWRPLGPYRAGARDRASVVGDRHRHRHTVGDHFDRRHPAIDAVAGEQRTRR